MLFCFSASSNNKGNSKGDCPPCCINTGDSPPCSIRGPRKGEAFLGKRSGKCHRGVPTIRRYGTIDSLTRRRRGRSPHRPVCGRPMVAPTWLVRDMWRGLPPFPSYPTSIYLTPPSFALRQNPPPLGRGGKKKGRPIVTPTHLVRNACASL